MAYDIDLTIFYSVYYILKLLPCFIYIWYSITKFYYTQLYQLHFHSKWFLMWKCSSFSSSLQLVCSQCFYISSFYLPIQLQNHQSPFQSPRQLCKQISATYIKFVPSSWYDIDIRLVIRLYNQACGVGDINHMNLAISFI